MNNQASCRLVKHLAQMSINSETDVKDNQRYYHLQDSFPPVNHSQLQRHFKTIAQDYLATFSGKDMRLSDDSFRESSLNGFDEMSFQYPNQNELVVDYLYNDSYYIFWLGTNQKFRGRGREAFQKAKSALKSIINE